MEAIDVGRWLQAELDRREWTQADLARRSGLSTGTIARIVNGSRGVGKAAANSLAEAFQIPTEMVYRAAGLLPEVSALAEQEEEFIHIYRSLPPYDQREVIAYLRFRAGMIPRTNIYAIYDDLSKQRPGILLLIANPGAVEQFIDQEKYNLETVAYIEGEGMIVEVTERDDKNIIEG